MRAIKVTCFIAVAVLAAGCNKAQRGALAADIGKGLASAIKKAGDETARQEFAKEFGPWILASLVGSAAPPGGPYCLLGTDTGWRLWAADGSAKTTDLPIGLRTFVAPPPQ
jgi:hypothetical protein